jgi:hypothetical protein
MRTARDISAIVFGVIKIAYSVGFFLLSFENWTSLYRTTSVLNVASWFAFIVYATTAFQPLSYRWARVIFAFIVFLIVPAAFSLVVTKQLVDADAAKLWFEVTFIATTALKFGIAGCIYVWSIYRERNAAGALRAN